MHDEKGKSVMESILATEAERIRDTPAPIVVYFDNTVPPANERDAHGLVAINHNRYFWVLDRAMRVVEVFDAVPFARVNTIALTHSLSGHPTPDCADISPLWSSDSCVS